MRLRLTFLLAWVGLFLTNVPARAILIETPGPRRVIAGYLDKEDAQQISVREKMPGGEENVAVFVGAKVKPAPKVDLKRLEELTGDNAQAYLEYAEELAKRKADPEATQLALRLFLIAASLDTPNLGSSCLLKMSVLATDPVDKRKYRALAFLLDPRGDPDLLKAEGSKAPPPQSKEGKALSFFRKALRQYRNGQYSDAQGSAKADGVEHYFRAAPDFMDQKSFIQVCKDTTADKSITEDYMDAVMRTEVWALDQILPAEAAAKKGASGGWSRVLSNQLVPPIPLLSLETISEFNPRECVFRKGIWVAP